MRGAVREQITAKELMLTNASNRKATYGSRSKYIAVSIKRLQKRRSPN